LRIGGIAERIGLIFNVIRQPGIGGNADIDGDEV
jgi:hypothetical protein